MDMVKLMEDPALRYRTDEWDPFQSCLFLNLSVSWSLSYTSETGLQHCHSVLGLS